jgi:hypothetical protein
MFLFTTFGSVAIFCKWLVLGQEIFKKSMELSDDYIFPDSVNDALIFLIFFLENYHLENLEIFPFFLNSMNESIIHSAFYK